MNPTTIPLPDAWLASPPRLLVLGGGAYARALAQVPAAACLRPDELASAWVMHAGSGAALRKGILTGLGTRISGRIGAATGNQFALRQMYLLTTTNTTMLSVNG